MLKTVAFYTNFPSAVMVPENYNLRHAKILIPIVWNNSTCYIESTIKITFVMNRS